MTDPSPDPAESGDARLGPERLLAFSDGVVAIALTLLVLPLADLVPDAVPPGTPGGSLITDHLAQIASFLLSFLVIGRFWIEHHRTFARARHASPPLVWWNLAWLLTVVVLPFPTEMVGVFTDDPFTLRFYVGTLFASSAVLLVTKVLVERTVPREERRRRFGGATTALLLVVLLLVVVVPGVGYTPLLLLFLTPVLEQAFEAVRAARHRRR